MGKPYTAGSWKTKPGLEDEFVRRWVDLAEWTLAEGLGSGRPVLLRDTGDPTRFVSYGAWESMEQIERWRAHPGFQERVGKLREVLEDFEPQTLELVAEPG
jgi:quinol monooxygenase YgiN